MDEFAPEEFDTFESEQVNALSDAFLAAGGDMEAVDAELDDDPIEPMDV